MQKLDLNSWIKVKLTPLGVEIFYNQHEDVIKMLHERGINNIEKRMPQIDKDGYTKMQLWCFINLYGQHLGATKPNVIIDNKIYVEDSDLSAELPIQKAIEVLNNELLKREDLYKGFIASIVSAFNDYNNEFKDDGGFDIHPNYYEEFAGRILKRIIGED